MLALRLKPHDAIAAIHAHRFASDGAGREHRRAAGFQLVYVALTRMLPAPRLHARQGGYSGPLPLRL